MDTSIFICFGDPDHHLGHLRRCASKRESTCWTIHADARPGDRAVFYLISPLSAFFATGLVAGFPSLNTDAWAGHYMADIRRIRLLPEPIPIRTVREEFKHWGWLKQPRRTTEVPEGIADRFWELLGAGD
jgi:hypothetical protein